ncbi:aldo/keto reductase [Plantactinospora soyae]|uniref:Diketogulonate reductase-like aldo/keto reductase n=1 Tax=Plantactinospora soyae TaxID=1544732 RepID=A0A927MK09_9ACTN|nr:aldo/keto reductase [Plantactinospora soyae]MBE1492580.1 diketogulonate reductase-like aldo/keto reductase [Plantactinospora soyae]
MTPEQQTEQQPQPSAGRESAAWRPNRREIIRAGGIGAAAIVGAGLAAGPAQGQSRRAGTETTPTETTPTETELITRTIPGSQQRLPAIGLGTFMTFDSLPGRGRDTHAEIVRTFWQAGGRVFDSSPVYGAAEANLGRAAAELRINDRMFVADKIWSTGDYLWDVQHAEYSLSRSMRRLSRRAPLDVVHCHSLVNVDVVVPLLHALKKEGRIRRLGISHHDPSYFPQLASWLERGALDVVQVHYSIHTRAAEERILPAAQERGVAVLVNMPLEKARLHRVVAGRPVPDFAREAGMHTWAEYFLKWVIAHPAVTCALPATSNPAHLAENVAAMRGQLPDPDMRERMRRHLETFPGFDQIGTMPWYPEKNYPGLVSRAQEALRRRSPWWP